MNGNQSIDDDDVLSGKAEAPFSFQRSLFANLNRFRNDNIFADVSLVVGDTTFRAHKVVLACHSEVFLAMFNSNMLEAQRDEVVINDVEPRTMSAFLDYMYTGVLPAHIIPDNNAAELYMCADKYLVKSLMLAMDKALLIITANPDNVLETLTLADSFDRNALKIRIYDTIWWGLAKIMRSELWTRTVLNRRHIMMEMLATFVNQDSTLDEMLVQHEKQSIRCRRNDIRHFPIYWRFRDGVDAFRPRSIRLFIGGKQLNFLLIVSQNPPYSMISLYSVSPIPDEAIVSYEACVTENEESNREVRREGTLLWKQGQEHPTLKHRRVEILRWDWWNPDRTAVDLKVSVDYNKFDCSNLPVVEEWNIEEPCSTTQNILEKCPSPSGSEDLVFLIFGQSRVSVKLKDFLDRLRPHENLWKSNELFIPHASETTVNTIVRYIQTGLLPSRDKVTTNLLETAWELQLSDLVMYLEQALIWDLDPDNFSSIAKVSLKLPLGWLMWACAQYIKVRLDIIVRDKDWVNFPFEFFDIIVKEMKNLPFPNLLPHHLSFARK